jgi:hypothetical protein
VTDHLQNSIWNVNVESLQFSSKGQGGRQAGMNSCVCAMFRYPWLEVEGAYLVDHMKGGGNAQT